MAQNAGRKTRRWTPRARMAALLLACGLLPQLAIAVDDPNATGPWNVGHTEFDIVDAIRANRTLPLDVWYPVDATDWTGTFAVYALLAGLGPISDLARTDSIVSNSGPWPLIVFSHGFGGLNVQSTHLCEHLASHGFIVVAPEHTGNTQADMSSPDPAADRYPDVAFVIDSMAQKNTTPADPFFGRVDTTDVGVAGHSYGGLTATMMASGFGTDPPDTRVTAIMPVAASNGILSDAQLTSVTIPTLLMVGTLDGLQSETIRSFNLMSSAPNLFRVDVIGANHTHFANVCDIGDWLISIGIPKENWESVGAGALIPIYEATCEPPAFSIDEATRIQNLYAAALFRRHLLGEAGYDTYLTESYALANEPDIDFYLPEPSQFLQLVSGVGMVSLLAFARRRSRPSKGASSGNEWRRGLRGLIGKRNCVFSNVR